MKRGLLATMFGMTMLCYMSGGGAQEQGTDNTVFIAFDYDSDPQTTTYAEAFRSSLGTNLQSEGFEARYDSEPGTFDTSLSFNVPPPTRNAEENPIVLRISPVSRDRLRESPILFARSDIANFIHYQAHETNGTQLALNYATGISLYSIERCDLAAPYFEAAAEISNSLRIGLREMRASLAFYRGNCAVIHKDYETAIEFYETVFQVNPERFRLHPAPEVNLAWTYVQVGREQEAFRLLTDVIKTITAPYQCEGCFVTEPINYYLAEVFVGRAQLYALAFRFDAAIADMDAAIELDPNNPELYVQRGQIVLLLYEWDRVLADYNHAIELDSNYADAYYYRGVLFYTQAYREEAFPDFQRYLELAPDGDHAADAAQYITDIQRELDALTEP